MRLATGQFARLIWNVYRFPIFIPFVVVAQMMRTFLAPHGLLDIFLAESAKILGRLSLPIPIAFGGQNRVYDVDIMMIGHFAKDKLVIDGTSEIASGGAVYYGGVALRRMGARVAVVTRLHSDDFSLLSEMKAEGVQIFAAPAPQTSGIENIYTTGDMERRICKPLSFAGPFSPQDIPDLRARIYLVAPIMAGEVDLPLLGALAQRGPVALDAQGFVRVCEGDELVFRDWPEKAEALAMVTYLKLDHAEAEALTSLTDVHAAARQIAAYGPREIMITHNGSVLVYAGEQAYEAIFTPRSMDGRTGRGDTCFATYLGKRLSAPPEEACRFAAAVTTLKMERPGPFRGTLAEVEAMIAQQARASGPAKVA